MTTDVEPTGSAGIWTTFRESPRAVKAILTGAFINRLGGLLNIFLVLFLTAKGYPVEQATLALGVYGAGAVVGVLIGGALADRLGARIATVVSMVGSGALLAALLYLPSYPLILIAVGLVSLVAQLYRPASSTLLAELTPKSRLVMTMAMYRFGLNLGTTAAPLVGFALYNLNHQQYTLLFWADATVAFLYAIVAFLALPAKPRTADPTATSAPKASYRVVLADRRYLLYLLATFFNAVVYVQYMSTLPLDVKAHGVAIFWYSAAISMNGFLVIAFELLLTKLSQNWPLRLTVGLAFGLVGAGVAVYGLPLGPAVIIIGTLIWTLGELVGGPAVFSYPAIAGPAHLKGRYIGSFQFMFGLGTAVGPMVGGVLFAQLGHAVWPVLALAGPAAAVLGVVAIRSPRKDADQPAAAVAPPAAAPPAAAADPTDTRPAGRHVARAGVQRGQGRHRRSPARHDASPRPLSSRGRPMNDATPLLLEMRLFTVRPGTREEFHRISHHGTIPLMRGLGIDVLAYGPASNNDDLYYLLRAFSSEEQRKEQARTLYASAAWERDFDTPVMGMIEDYRIAVMPATPTLIAEFAAVPNAAVDNAAVEATGLETTARSA